MNRHVKVVGLEGISHFPKTLQTVFPCSLFKAKRFRRFLAFLRKGRTGQNPSADRTPQVQRRSKIFTSATHFGQRQLPLGGSVSGGSKQ